MHADDVADAIVRILEARIPGAFNLAAAPAVTADDIAPSSWARPVPLPAAVRAAVSRTWHARLQQVDPGGSTWPTPCRC